MSLLKTQPQRAISIDRSNYAGRNVLRAWCGSSPLVEVVTQNPIGKTTGANAPIRNSASVYGETWKFPTTDSYATITPETSWLPLTEITVIIHHRKLNTTNTAGSAFGLVAGVDSTAMHALLPHSNTNVYWDFGGTSGNNRLLVTALTFGNDMWVFNAGPRGMEIWQNGILRGRNATATPPRTQSTSQPLYLNSGLFGLNVAPFAEHAVFAVLKKQMPVSVCIDLCRNPWQIFTESNDPIHVAPSSATTAKQRNLLLMGMGR